MYLTYPYTFANGDSGIDTRLNANFAAIKTVLTSQLGDTNLKSAQDLGITTLTSTGIVTLKSVNAISSAPLTMKITTANKSFRVVNSADSSLLVIPLDKRITIPKFPTAEYYYPIGTITYFKGTFTNNVTILGWYKCDGLNGTPNLINRFLIADSISGIAGGYSNVTLAQHTHTASSGNNSATHTHTFSNTTAATDIIHKHTIEQKETEAAGTVIYVCGNHYTDPSLDHYQSTTAYDNTTHHHTFSFSTGNNTSNHTHAITVASQGDTLGVGWNAPAYTTLVPIIRIA